MNDDIWKSSLSEAADYLMPFNLRQYFCTLLLHGEVADANQLFHEYKLQMSQDLAYRMADRPLEVRHCTLEQIYHKRCICSSDIVQTNRDKLYPPPCHLILLFTNQNIHHQHCVYSGWIH